MGPQGEQEFAALQEEKPQVPQSFYKAPALTESLFTLKGPSQALPNCHAADTQNFLALEDQI